METILVPKGILLRGYNAKLHEMIHHKYSWFPLSVCPHDPWNDEAEAYDSDIREHFELIRKSNKNQFGLVIAEGGKHV